MPLRADSSLTATPPSSKLPANFSFSAMILDSSAATPAKATIGLHLAEGNDLTFAGDVKSVTQEVSIGRTPVRVSFSKKVNGNGAGLAAFKVTMRDSNERDIVATFVRVE